MTQLKHTAVWFEIPVHDLDRARRFYEQVLEVELAPEELGPYKMAVFPGGDAVVHGALVQGEDCRPGGDGPLVYLNGGDDLSAPLARIERAGGHVVTPKTSIGSHGFMAIFQDTEGNRLALHSMR